MLKKFYISFNLTIRLSYFWLYVKITKSRALLSFHFKASNTVFLLDQHYWFDDTGPFLKEKKKHLRRMQYLEVCFLFAGYTYKGAKEKVF